MDRMIGQDVSGVEYDSDGLHVNLGPSYWLSIFNKFELSVGNDGSVNNLIGAKLLNFVQGKDEFVVEFDSNRSLRISLLPEDYSGPEAANFFGPSGEVAVL